MVLQTGSYKQPRKLNMVSLVVLLGILAGVYAAVQFGPVYARKWKAKEILSESVHQYYTRRRVSGGEEQSYLQGLREKTVAALRAAGIVDPNLMLSFTKSPRLDVTGILEYEEVISHPGVNKITRLRFRPYVSVADAPSTM